MAIPEFLNENLNNIFIAFSDQIPQQYMPFIVLAFYTILITVYAIFVWKFYKFLARRNILELNLNQYNKTEHPFWNKLLASYYFLLEYIVIVPIIVFFWFSVFSAFILLLSEIDNVNQILLISAAVIAATRLVAYYSEELAEEVIGVFPITLLVVFLLEPNFFSLQKLITRFSELPSLFENILIFLVFIAILEIVMRGLVTIIDLFSSGEEDSSQK